MMKKDFSISLALIIALAFTSIVCAQFAPQDKGASKKEGIFKGKVTAVDLLTNSLFVQGKKSEETFQVAPTAKIEKDKKEGRLADIKKDEKVTVIYRVEGKRKIATRIK